MSAIKTWNEAKYLELIQQLQKYPTLWNVHNKGERCREMKRKCRIQIAKEMGCTANQVVNAIQKIMSKYAKERSNEDVFLKTTKSSGKEFKPTFFAYKSMKFLDQTRKKDSPNATTKNSEEAIDDCQVMDIPASHIPLQGISEDIVTPNNSDSAVRSTGNHESKSEDLDKNTCQTCGKTFLQNLDLMEHMEIHLEPCYTCGKTFENKYDLLKHVWTHLQKPEEDSDDCQIMDIPAIPKPFIDISEDIVTPDNSDSAVRSTVIHEFKSENFEKGKPEEDSDDCQIIDIPAIPKPFIDISEDIVTPNNSDSAVRSTVIQEFKSENFEKSKSEKVTDDRQVMDIPVSHIPLQGISEDIVTPDNSKYAVRLTRHHVSRSEDFEKTKSEEVDDDRQVMDIPASHVPLQGTSEDIVTPNNPDSADRSTRNHESKSEDFEKTNSEEVIDDRQVMDILVSHIPLQGISEDIVTPNKSDSSVFSTRNHKSRSENFEKTKSKESIDKCQVMDIPASHTAVQGTLETILAPDNSDSAVGSIRNNEWKWENFEKIKSEEDIDDYQEMDIPASNMPLQGISESIVIPNTADLSVNSTKNHESKSKDLEETVRILKDVTQRFTQSDEFSIYGQYVSNKLRNYSERTRAIAEGCINSVLFSADIGDFEKPLYVSEPAKVFSFYPKSA